MRRFGRSTLAILAGILAGVSIAACHRVSEPARNRWADWDNWTISFQNEQTAEYGGSGCTPNGSLYCKTWHADRYGFSGNLHRKAGAWILELPKQNYPGTETTTISGLWVVLNEDAYCASYALLIPAVGDSMSGTFSYARDCHGSWRTGTFAAHR